MHKFYLLKLLLVLLFFLLLLSFFTLFLWMWIVNMNWIWVLSFFLSSCCEFIASSPFFFCSPFIFFLFYLWDPPLVHGEMYKKWEVAVASSHCSIFSRAFSINPFISGQSPCIVSFFALVQPMYEAGHQMKKWLIYHVQKIECSTPFFFLFFFFKSIFFFFFSFPFLNSFSFFLLSFLNNK